MKRKEDLRVTKTKKNLYESLLTLMKNKTFEEIAEEENCTKRAVKFSVDIAIEKISKKFKN